MSLSESTEPPHAPLTDHERLRLQARIDLLEAQLRHLRAHPQVAAPPSLPPPSPTATADPDPHLIEAVRLADDLRRAHDELAHIRRSLFWRARTWWLAVRGR